MKRAHLLLFVAGALVASGMITSYVGSGLVRQGVTHSEGVLNGTTIEVTKELDPTVNESGTFFVVANAFVSNDLTVRLFGPDGIQMDSITIEKEKTDKKFEINTKGTYKIILENARSVGSQYMIGLSYTPDRSIEAVNYLGAYLMISGFVGAIIAIVYVVISKRRVN